MWIEWLSNTIIMHRSLLILYQDWYYQLETDMCARMSQSCMEELEQKLMEGRTTFSATAEAIHQIERELSPYMDAGSFYSRGVDGAYETAQNTVTTLKTAIGEYEEYHKNNDFSYTDEMLESMGRIIQGQLRGSGANIRNYQPGSLKQTEAYQKAGAVNRMQEMYIGLVKEEVEASEANYVERKEAWEEELRKRKEQELIHIIEGIGIMIVGTYVTITTMGAGLPMVVTAAEVVLGSTATVYGASNNMEALSNLYQAMGGDARSTAFNPIRDTIFASNPELYYKIGNTATMLTVLSLPVGMSMEAAVAVGGSPLRAGITELGKFGISTIAGEVTTDKVTEWTGSEALGIIAGMGTSSLSYGGLSAVDYKVNISGLHETGGNTRIGNVTGSGKSGSGSIGEGIESGTTTISSADRIKIDAWDYTPSDELYLKYKKVFDNPKYYNQKTGAINWPQNDGFASTPIDEVLQPGTRIDRYGSDFGSFTSPEGIPYEMRAVAPGTDLKPYSVFEVVEPINVKAGEIAPWFDEPGGGIQYLLPDTVDELLDAGILRRIK